MHIETMTLTDKKTIVNERKIYSREEAVKESIEYFKGDELAANVWLKKKFLHKQSSL